MQNGGNSIQAVMPDDQTAAAIADRLSAVSWGRHDTLAAALDATDGPVLVALTLPVPALTAALAAGTAPDEALAAWSDQTAGILTTLRGARRRVVVMDAAALADGHPESVAVLADRFGVVLALQGQGGATEPASDAPADPTAQARAWMGAVALLAADRDAGVQADTLLASLSGPALPVSPPVSVLATAIARNQAPPAPVADPVGAPGPARDDQALMRESLAQTLEEMAALHEAADAAAAAVPAARAAERAAANRREAVLSAALMTAQGDADALAAALADETARADGRSATLEAVYRSRSWRITAPMRALRGGAS